MGAESLRAASVAGWPKSVRARWARGVGRLASSGAFLDLALAPPKENTPGPTPNRSESYIATELISDLELGNRVLGDYKAVVLCAVGQVAPTLADQLALFVK